MWKRLFGSSKLTLEQKLEVLARGGLHLQAPFSVDHLLQSWDRQEFERPGFDLVLVGLGMTEEQEPWRNHCVNAWHFDTEAIEDHGAYVTIAERMRAMAQGSLPIENIRDYVDIEEGKAWLEFELRGEPIHVDCKIQDDWVDPAIFGHFVTLLAKTDPSKIYLYYDLHGQDCIIACTTKEQFKQLKSEGVGFKPLS